jgi:hypothetical protein
MTKALMQQLLVAPLARRRKIWKDVQCSKGGLVDAACGLGGLLRTSCIAHHASRITHHTHHLHCRTGVHAEVPQLAAVVRGACNLHASRS